MDEIAERLVIKYLRKKSLVPKAFHADMVGHGFGFLGCWWYS